MTIRKMRSEDRGPVLKIIRGTGMFTEAETDVAMELIDIYLDNPSQKDYEVIVSECDSAVAGYACYGPTPATEGTYDLYWIAVSHEIQRKGVGRELLKFVEGELVKASGRILIIETSSREKYRPTQNFYDRNGYHVEAVIKDFYSPGDNRLIYVKKLTNA